MQSTETDRITKRLLATLQPHLRLVGNDQTFPMDLALKDLGLDSLSAINLLLDLENTFEISFPDSMLTEKTFRTASTLQAAIQSLIDDQTSSEDFPNETT